MGSVYNFFWQGNKKFLPKTEKRAEKMEKQGKIFVKQRKNRLSLYYIYINARKKAKSKEFIKYFFIFINF